MQIKTKLKEQTKMVNNAPSLTKYSNSGVLKSYFKFNFKYLMKRKSTWLAPLIFYTLLLAIATLFSFVTALPEAGPIAVAGGAVTGGFLVIFLAILGISKGITLFREPTTEGVEILVVSKPLERWQILLVKAIIFNAYGLVLFALSGVVLTTTAVLTKISSSQYLMNGLGIPLGAWFGYIFFGSFSILLSIKFSSKLVSGLVSSIVVFGNIIASSLDAAAPVFFTSKTAAFNEQLSQNNDALNDKFQSPAPEIFFNSTQVGQNPELYLGKSIFSNPDNQTQRSLTFKKLYQLNAALELSNIWNQSADSLWINQLFIFINPVAAFKEIGSMGIARNVLNVRPGSRVNYNEVDFNWSAQVKANFSSWNDVSGNQYSLYGIDLSNPQKYTNTANGFLQIEDSFLTRLGSEQSSFRRNNNENKLTYNMINEQKDIINNIIDNQLRNITSKTAAINQIQAVVASQFDQSFFDQFTTWNHVRRESDGSQTITPGSSWTSDPTKQAEFIYYLAQIIAVNEFFDLQGQFNDSANRFRQEAAQVETFNPNDNSNANAISFFGEELATKVVRANQLSLVELVPTERLPLWGLALFWFPMIIALNALAVWFYFKRDFE